MEDFYQQGLDIIKVEFGRSHFLRWNDQDFHNFCPEARRLGKDYLKCWSQESSGLHHQTTGAVRLILPWASLPGVLLNERACPRDLAPLLSLAPLESIHYPLQLLRNLTVFSLQSLPLWNWFCSAFQHWSLKEEGSCASASWAPPLASGWGAVIAVKQTLHCTLSSQRGEPYVGVVPLPAQPGRVQPLHS